MRFNGFTLITDDVPRLARFYAMVAGAAVDGDDVHAELALDGVTVAIYARTAAERDMRLDFSVHGGTGRAGFGFTVADVDAEHERLVALGVVFETAPKTHPWGWRSAQFRDPDGHLVTIACPP